MDNSLSSLFSAHPLLPMWLVCCVTSVFWTNSRSWFRFNPQAPNYHISLSVDLSPFNLCLNTLGLSS